MNFGAYLIKIQGGRTQPSMAALLRKISSETTSKSTSFGVFGTLLSRFVEKASFGIRPRGVCYLIITRVIRYSTAVYTRNWVEGHRRSEQASLHTLLPIN